MKTIFITGASAGLGKAAAKLFQAKGWHVIATMRNHERENVLKYLDNVTVISLDVTNKEQIQSTIAGILEMHSVDVVLKLHLCVKKKH
ncbi:SDR family NAD(P)-dependent oxidoreductase [Chryseobacterium kimseyorum]|uniref:SDR family NAD(P)-dependent oxidoreductase n=1 Tax=Chryseobacterium kimseyorum TaxID=2984028 RepID=UPI0029D41C09|nr:SDR family NAD(P)-dependent oxidoreductase [Chryseobacterium kimseyorum]